MNKLALKSRFIALHLISLSQPIPISSFFTTSYSSIRSLPSSYISFPILSQFHSQTHRLPSRLQPSSSSPLYHTTSTVAMPRGVKKENLPSKVCVVCNRPFTWRKKWESVWDEVTTCSKSCNRKRRQMKQKENYNMKLMKASTTDNSNEEPNNIDDMEEESSFIKPFSSNEDEEESLSSLLDELHLKESETKTIKSDSATSCSSSCCSIKKPVMASDEESYTKEEPKEQNQVLTEKQKRNAIRKAEKKRKKAERRLQREGKLPSGGQKDCDMCGASVDLLIRCTYDASQEWKMVCGKCWKKASGGVVDGDANHPYYKYGGKYFEIYSFLTQSSFQYF